jgi:hypothetical protein
MRRRVSCCQNYQIDAGFSACRWADDSSLTHLFIKASYALINRSPTTARVERHIKRLIIRRAAPRSHSISVRLSNAPNTIIVAIQKSFLDGDGRKLMKNVLPAPRLVRDERRA